MDTALWARVSSDEQVSDNQLRELRQWAADRGLSVVAEFVTEDSAWSKGANGTKGQEFDRQRAALLEGARMGRYHCVLLWGVDRLSRRGAEDMLGYVRQITDLGVKLESLKDPWLASTSDPFARELLLSVFGTIARFESERRSQRVKAGLARRRARGLPVGGRKSGARDRRPRRNGWTDERKAALAERNRARTAS